MNIDLLNLLLLFDKKGGRYTTFPLLPNWENTLDQSQWDQSLLDSYDKTIGLDLYIHIPFCKSLCTFCGLNIHITNDRSLAKSYINKLLEEYQYYKEMLKKVKINNLFISGGTPTFLTPEELRNLITELDTSKETLCSIEVDPRITTKEHLAVLSQFKNLRVSYGIQDFDEEVMNNLNRSQSSSDIFTFNEMLADFNISDINLDFIYGLPLQDQNTFSNLKEYLDELSFSTIALYPFTKVPWQQNTGKAYGTITTPDLSSKYKIYLNAKDQLESLNLKHIGMGHFIKRDTKYLQSNSKRTMMGPVINPSEILLGLGTSSISYTNNCYKQNEKVTQKYISTKEIKIENSHRLGPDETRIKDIMSDIISHNKIVKEKLKYTSRNDLGPFFEIKALTENDTAYLITSIGIELIKNICEVICKAEGPAKNI